MNKKEQVSPTGAVDGCFALVDCNNFYASCERAFNPKLRGEPIVVLSNNDGCIVARSNEAKALGFGMGEPFFKSRHLVEKHKVHVFSSNYTLYGDMSRRVMAALAYFSPEVEIYSIDEAFLDLNGCDNINGYSDLTAYARAIRTTVTKWTGIPVSVGLARTKTLAKIANRLAKKSERTRGVLNLVDSPYLDQALERIYVWDVWGIGRQHGKRLVDKGIINARQLRDIDDKVIRKQMGIVGVRLVHELRGISCLQLETCPQPRKGVVSSRSFGRAVVLLSEIKESVAAHVTNAAARLRSQNLAAKLLTVFLLTNRFKKDEAQYNKSIIIRLPTATSNTAELIHYAMHGTDKIFKEGYRYKKAGVMLDELIPDDQVQATLFDYQNVQRDKKLMRTLDLVNNLMGSGTLKYAAQGCTQPWKMKCELRTPRYTTSWKELTEVK
ncbi:MAG: Y-family DNA polymerase [Candidatus Zixiibacteriota bacterium]